MTEEKSQTSRRLELLIALIASLFFAFIDVIITILPGFERFSSFSFVLLILAGNAVLYFFLYQILLLVLVAPLGKKFNLAPLPLAVSFAVFLVFTLLLDTVKRLYLLSQSMTNLFMLFGAFLFFCLLFSLGVYFTVLAAESAKVAVQNKLTGIISAGCYIGAVLVVFIWWQKHRLDALFSLKVFAISAAVLVVVSFLILLLFLTLFKKIRPARAVTFLFVLVLVLPLLSALWGALFRGKGERTLQSHNLKHVILIIIDSLRRDVPSCYGGVDIRTPNIDDFARDALVFDQAYSVAPWTAPSVFSTMTAVEPRIHRATTTKIRLADTFKTWAEYMSEAGYYTTAIGANPVLGPVFNLTQGFDEYDFFPRPSYPRHRLVSFFRTLLPESFREDATSEDLTDITVDWLEENREKDFFLWLHYFDPHLPYSPPRDYLPQSDLFEKYGGYFNDLRRIRSGYIFPDLQHQEWIKTLYLAEARYVDDQIVRVFETLKRLNIYDETLIIVTSDHGEEFWDHGGFEHGHSIYNELIRVPLIVKMPGSAKKGREDTLIPQQALMPTILDLCGIDYSPETLSYLSISPLLESSSETAYDSRPVVSTGLLYYEDRESIVQDGVKYIRSLITDKEELYDLNRDPAELDPLPTARSRSVQRAIDHLEKNEEKNQKLREFYDTMNREKTEVDQSTLDRLKSLGYVN